MEKGRLGRSLDDLLGGVEGGTALAVAHQAQVSVEQIQHNPFQPRKTFDDEELARLSESVRSHGILQPLLVRPAGDQYQLVAGERRLRAAQAAGLSSVPVCVVDFNDQQTLEAALIENIHRTDLNPIEKAQGFKEYLDRFQMSQEQMSERLGLARSTITNLLGLLDLTPTVQDAVRYNQISLGHAKLLKSVREPERQVSLCKQIITQGLSVHAAEMFAREQKVDERGLPRSGDHPTHTDQGDPLELPVPTGGEEKSNHVKAIEDELRQRFATPVEIRLRAKDKGQIIIGFESNDDFMRLLDYLRK
jgi:ParB family chromosome partitioning protein